MKIHKVFVLIFIAMVLSACTSPRLAVDTLPWLGDEPILFKDSFSSKTGGWFTYADDQLFSGYAQGGFRLRSNVKNYQFWSVPGLNFKDTVIFTRAKKLSGPEDNLYGVLCRYQDDSNYYALVISSDGYYGIFKTLLGEQSLIAQESMDFSEVIHGDETPNDIQAVCQDERLSLIVNGVPLLQVQDSSLANGDIGLVVGNFLEPGVDILFDDLIVASPASP
ncbi:MAG: hypothetical protein ACK2TV_06785 [Anaerolineales bacterium]